MPKKAAVRHKKSPETLETPQNVEPSPWQPGWLLVRGARQNNLKSIDVSFPLSAFTAVCGVSGSGKSSLIKDILYKALAKALHRAHLTPGAYDAIEGIERVNKVICVDQQPIGQTPSSNPATYTGVFEVIRDLFARLPESRMRGYSARRFSFNVPGGRCERCEGNGQLKIEMHFLPDIWITCDSCNGKRYERQTLEVKFHGHSISDVLEMSCGDALKLFRNIPSVRRILQTLCDVGLDYVSLGQPAPTLSGGEAQRVKLASELSRPDTGRTLYILDEPTTGLHFEDLAKLLEVLQRLVDLGNTVIVIEHNLDVIKSADWIIELGPEAGLEGGNLTFAGTPEELIHKVKSKPRARKNAFRSYTAESLLPVMENGRYEERTPYVPSRENEEDRETERNLEAMLVAASGPTSRPPSLQELLAESLGEETLTETKMPWEINGRQWHTKDRLSRGGFPCRWEGRILSDVIDAIQEAECFAETNWNNRSVVEIAAEKKSLGWFFHAITGEEWLLKMKFRVAKNTFRREELVQSLQLRPLNELDDIPLYGTEPRVRVQQTNGPWQEIELKVNSYSEIDREEFWDFLERAIAGFERFTDKARKSPEDLMPWKLLKEKWHLTPKGLIGGSKLQWDISLLGELFALLKELAPEAEILWTNKVLVPYYLQPVRKLGGRKIPWVVVNTKRCEAVLLEIFVQKNAIPLGKILTLGHAPFVNGENEGFDILQLRFRDKKEMSLTKLKALLEESLEKRV